MSRIPGRLALTAALATGLLAAPAVRAAGHPDAQFRITNDAHKVVECTLLVDGHTRTYLKVHMGKAYWDTFSQGRLLQLACIRGKEDVFGPLKLGVDYRFVDAPGNRVDIATPP